MISDFLLPLALLFQDDAAPAQPSADLFGGSMVPIILIVGIFYMVLLRPERKKQKERKEMLSAVQKGDRVMTTSGMYGNVTLIQEDIVTLQVADGVRIKFSRAAISDVIREKKSEDDKDS